MTRAKRQHSLTYAKAQREYLKEFREDAVEAVVSSFPKEQWPVTRIAVCRGLGIAQGTSYCGPWVQVFRKLKWRGVIQ